MVTIIEDKRKIESIWFDSCDEDSTWCITVGEKQYEKDEIKPYHENGEMAPIVWFEVIKDGIVTCRINSKHTTGVSYFKEIKQIVNE